MILPWRDKRIGAGPYIPTSLTDNEASALWTMAPGQLVIEVGAAYGYSTILMAQVAERVVSIDPHMGYGSLPNSLEIMRANLEAYGVTDKVEVIHGQAAYEALWEMSTHPTEQVGLVFIDGDHREDAVRRDVFCAMNLSRRIACHDYGEETCPDVRRVLDEMERLGTGPTRIVDTLWIREAA